MKKIYSSIVIAICVLLVSACNKTADYSGLKVLNLMGAYNVVYEAQEYIDVNGDLVSLQACATEDIVVITEEYFTWQVGNGKCPSKDYYEFWPYYIALDKIHMFSTYNIVEHWDGQKLKLVSSEDATNGRYVLELVRR